MTGCDHTLILPEDMLCTLIYKRKDAEYNKAYIDFYRHCCMRRDLDFSLLFHEEYHSGLLSRLRDGFVINRSRDAALSRLLEDAGIPVFNNSEVSFLGNDKLEAIQKAREWGLPVMRTESDPKAFDGQWPLVMKSRDGHGGSEVFSVHSQNEIRDILGAFPDKRFLYQEFCDTPGRDLRIYIVGNRIAASMLRTSDTDFRSNYSLGGNAKIHELSDEERALAEAVLSRLTIGHAGIDLIYHGGHPVFNELEDVVGSRMLYRYTDIDVVSEYMDHILRTLKKE